MKKFEFDVKLTVKELYAFSMRHTYFKFSGVFGVLLSIAALVYCLVGYGSLDDMTKVVLLIIGSLFIIVQPIMLFMKAQTQIKKNEGINDTLHYFIDEEGITISQKEQQAQIEWNQIRKIVKTKKADYLYTSPVRAMILPKSQCVEVFDEMTSFVETQIKSQKR